MARNFKVGEAPWELEEQAAQAKSQTVAGAAPSSFAVGQAPWELEQAPIAPPPPDAGQFSTGESALQGFGQGASLGYLPELQAGADVVLSKILPQSWGGDKQRSFQQALKEWRKREGAIQAEDPLAYGAGAVGGGLALPMPGATVARGGTALARLAKSAAGGAGMGLVMNPGETEDQFEARLAQATQGGLLAGGLSGLGQGLVKAGGAIKKGREALALKLAGARKAHFKEFPAGSKKRTEVVEFMEKEGMLKPGQTFESVNEKATKIADVEGSKIGDVHRTITDDIQNIAEEGDEAIKAAADATKLTARDLAADVLKAARKEFKGQAEGKSALAKLRGEMKNLAALDKRKTTTTTQTVPTTRRGPLGETIHTTKQVTTRKTTIPETPFEEILDYRKSLDDVINYQKTFMESKTGEKALKFARNKIKEKLDQRITNLDTLAKMAGDDEVIDRVNLLKKLNDRYSKASHLRRISGDRIAGEEAKVNLGLLETIAGTGIAGSEMSRGASPTEALTKGLVGGIMLRQARKYGPGVSYSGLKAVERAAPIAGKIGAIPYQTYVTPWLLMNREGQ